MKMQLLTCTAMFLTTISCSKPPVDYTLLSPNGNVSVKIIETDSCAMYQVHINGIIVINPSRLGITLKQDDHDFLSGLHLVNIEEETIDEEYTIPSGEQSHCSNFANQKIFEFRNSSGNSIHLPDHDNSADADIDEIIVENGFISPWRDVIIGNSLGTIVESIMVQNLNPSSRIADESWLSPGVAAFPWWSDFFANDSKETMMKFIDLVEEMEWEYVEFDIGLIGNDGWRTSDSPVKRETLYSLYMEMGIKGIKLDYLNGDKQKTMEYMANTVSEAVKGGEYYQFSENYPTPVHNTIF